MKKEIIQYAAHKQQLKITLAILVLIAHCSLFIVNCFSQTAINTTGNQPNASAMLDASSSNQGVLISRMATSQRDAITSPAASLMIFNTTTNCFEAYVNGAWNIVSCPTPCSPPLPPTNVRATNIQCNSFTANWNLSNNATTYFLDVSTTNSFSTFITGFHNLNIGNTTTYNITGLTFGTTYYYQVRAAFVNCIGVSSNPVSSVTTLSSPSAPTAGTSTAPSSSQIVWNWNPVSNATGYKWNTINDYSTAYNNGSATSYTQSGLSPYTTYSFYVWAYNACGNNSSVLILNMITRINCGASITVNYTPGSNGVPSNSPTSITYGTTNAYISSSGVCWITKSLGATVQPTSIFDPRAAASGWYFQYNRSQAYYMADDGVTITPSSGWVTNNPNSTGWSSGNDPCSIQLGSGWRLPTWSEYYPLPWGWNHDNCAAASSPLAIAGSGYLELTTSTAHIYHRPSTSCDLSSNLNSGAPFYWSSSVYSGYVGTFWTPGWTYPANQNWSNISNVYALPVRCVHQ
jgi:hypothetical protein